jgi:hypothetical protein
MAEIIVHVQQRGSRSPCLGSALANRLNHIFNPKHYLDPLVNQFGSQLAAYKAIQAATQEAVEAQGVTGIFETQVQVGNSTVTVTGNVVNGTLKLGNAWIPHP